MTIAHTRDHGLDIATGRDIGAEFAEVWREDPFEAVGGVRWDPELRRRVWWGER